jgi:hypothetical protein
MLAALLKIFDDVTTRKYKASDFIFYTIALRQALIKNPYLGDGHGIE